MADLAIWMAGHVSVPVFPILPVETVRHVLEHSGARLLFVGKLDPVWRQMRSGVPAGLPTIAFPLAPDGEGPRWDDVMAGAAPLADPVPRSPDEMATIIYTSGSTGVPKGAMISFRSMLVCSEHLVRVLSLTAADRYLSYLPVAHSMERWLGECVPLVSGSHVFFAETLDTFLRDLHRARPTIFLSVPRLWVKFQRGVFEKIPERKLAILLRIPLVGRLVAHKILGRLGLDRVRIAGSGSAPLPAEVMSWYRSLGLELLEGYGMTENFNFSHLSRPGRVRPGYVGEPYDLVECRLSEEGEVQVRTPGRMIGYYRMPEESAAVILPDGFLRTGDRGEVDAQGRLRITGRTKEIFKTSKGKYIAPAPLENLLVNHPRIELCCVAGAGFPQPHALVQISDAARGADPGEVARELAEHLRRVNESLQAHERLEFLAVVRSPWTPENGFLTPTLKIRRAQIEEAYGPFAEGWYSCHRPVVFEPEPEQA
jgi:long-chain acyl-CoA synthetase